MKKNGLRVSAVSPLLRVADIAFNVSTICEELETAYASGTDLLVFPELSICGSTCGDLYLQPLLADSVLDGLKTLVARTQGKETLVFVGAPLFVDGKGYDCAVAVQNGRLLGVVPKTSLSAEEARWFALPEMGREISLLGEKVSFDARQIFTVFGVTVACTVGGIDEVRTDVEILVNLSSEKELVRSAFVRRERVKRISFEAPCAVITANPCEDESTTDAVYAGHDLVAVLGEIVAESNPFADGRAKAALDVESLKNARRMRVRRVYQGLKPLQTDPRTPFLPAVEEREEYCSSALEIQARGLARRLKQIGAKTAVLGVSGGLDSTLALLVTARAFDILGKARKDIVGVTMPGFGTTGKTYRNALKLIEKTGASLREIPIAESVTVHFKDIGHNGKKTDAAYENAQARMRTLILMDIANMENGLVVGTGDLSELALGWCTYNGDHMSMYSVNGSVPKTLVKYLVGYAAEKTDGELQEALLSVVNTDISPELLPPDQAGNIAQKTEDLVGPYELHDFYIYHALYKRRAPKEIFDLAKASFAGKYSDATLKKWLTSFYRRFFSQQFKRSCSPDGVQITPLSLSPRSGYVMPSDASASLWLAETEKL